MYLIHVGIIMLVVRVLQDFLAYINKNVSWKDKTKVLIPQVRCCKILLIFHNAIRSFYYTQIFSD